MAVELKNMHRQGHDTASIGSVMRPLHQAVKDVSRTMTESQIYQRTSGHAPSGYVTPVPATPLSAALGPAALATVPNTPREMAIIQSQNEYFVGGGTMTGAGEGLRTTHSMQGDKTIRYARDVRNG